jgi:DNA-binding NarL/FixJ family response regulator
MLAERSRSFTIGTVLASNQWNDLSSLDILLRGSAWKLIKVSTCGETTQAIRHQRAPIILCDVALEGQPWQMTLRKLRMARSECGVVFLSNEPDPDLSREIAEHSRLGLLVRPLERELVFHSLFLAYGRWLSRLVYTQGYLGRYVPEGGSGGPPALSERNTVRTR